VDNISIDLGAGSDVTTFFDGTDWIFDSRVVGTGDYEFRGGDVRIDRRLEHTGDINTWIGFATDQIDFNAGGIAMLRLDEAAVDIVTINPNGVDLDFRVQGDTDSDLFFLDAGLDMIGFSTAAPTSLVDIQGSFSLKLDAFTSNTTLDATHSTVTGDATSASFTFTLPTAVGIKGRIYRAKKIDSTGNTVTLDGNGTETIDGGLTLVLAIQYDVAAVQSDGANWIRL